MLILYIYIASALFTVAVHSQMFSLLLFEKHCVFVHVQKRVHVNDNMIRSAYNEYKTLYL